MTAAAVTTAVAIIAPVVALIAIALGMGWRLSHEPEHWAAWIPALAATWGALVTAGYFIITAALFHMTARQAEAAAQQAEAAADAAQLSATESSMNAAAVRGTIALQRLERRRWWEPLRSALEMTHHAVQRVVTKAAADKTGSFLRNVRDVAWWNDSVLQQWTNADWLLPEARDEFRVLRSEMQALDKAFETLLRNGATPTQFEVALPRITEMAQHLAAHVSELIARVNQAADLGVTTQAPINRGGGTDAPSKS